jgi:uncharacterized protein (DUF2236 family)
VAALPTAPPLKLPGFLQARLDAAALALLQPPGGPAVDFARPPGEPALVGPDSVSWRVFKNPVSLFIGGVAAVILELAEPGVRTGVWEHSNFRAEPGLRLGRTGLAAMMTVYGPKSAAEAMIAGVVRRHGRVSGQTPDGAPYNANDEPLLTWVQATASYGFAEAYSRYVRPLTPDEIDRLYAEAAPASKLYGALNAPRSDAERAALFDSMRDRLEPSPVVFEFLQIMGSAPLMPGGGLLQRMLVRAAVEMTPGWVRERLGLGPAFGLRPWEAALVRRLGALADRLVLASTPAVQSCLRLGLPADYLYR